MNFGIWLDNHTYDLNIFTSKYLLSTYFILFQEKATTTKITIETIYGEKKCLTVNGANTFFDFHVVCVEFQQI